MAPKLYGTLGSPPCRAVLLTAKAVGLDLNMTEVDVRAGGTKTPEFIKMSPQHAVPVFEDNGLILAESRAIMEYIVDAYGKTDSLLPKDIKQRALVSSRMYFDATTLYMRHLLADLGPAIRGLPLMKATIVALEESLTILDTLIGDGKYLVGDQLTIADITTVVTVSNIEAVGHNVQKYPNVNRWYSNVKSVIPGYQEINQKGANLLGGFVKPILEKMTPQ